MKNKISRRSIIKSSNLIKIVTLLMIIFILLGVFVACGGLPASSNRDEEKQVGKVNVELLEPPELSKIEISSHILPPYVVQTDADDPEEKEPAKVYRYVASRESDKYHRISCHYVDNILPKNKVYYYTKESAKRAGKSPCSVCKP